MHKALALVAAGFFSISPAIAAPAPAGGSGIEIASSAAPAPAHARAGDQTNKPGQPAAKSLYDRLGGIFAIAAVVDRFSDAIITNPKLNRNPALVEWNTKESATRLPGLKFMRTLWVAALAGGPFKYTGMPLHDAHTRFALTSEEFDEVGAEIVRALDFYKVPEREKQELVTAYMRSKPDVVRASR
jgi:hemoglobin